MALLNFVLPTSNASVNHPSITHLSSLDKQHLIFKRNVEVSSRRAVPRTNPASQPIVRCLKGVAFPETSIINQLLKVDSVLPFPLVPVTEELSRKDFPTDFMFGCSTSALQTEGSGTEGGRGPSTWDSFIGTNEKAVDSYNRYKEDVQALKSMGADCYRFSISWSRLLPKGTISGGINQEGITFYNNFINELIKNGITPVVTLFHFDLPTALQNKYNGFLDSQIVDDFKAYADLCFKTYGDRVKYWITINEPQVFGQYGYKMGLSSSYKDIASTPFIAIHNIILSHATAAKLYQETYKPTQKGEIGISLVVEWFEPESSDKPDKDAAERAFDFLTGWMLEPLVFGDYPFIMKAVVGKDLPTFTTAQQTLIKGSYDYIGVNYYTSRYATAVAYTYGETYSSFSDYQHVTLSVYKDGKLLGEKAPGSSEIYVYPPGLGKALVYIHTYYKQPKIYVTENGYPEKRDDSIPEKTALQDDARITHMTAHMTEIAKAIKEGANVKSYCMWSLMDCLEMGSSYNVRYGLYYTDYSTLNRIAKKSSSWLKNFNTTTTTATTTATATATTTATTTAS